MRNLITEKRKMLLPADAGSDKHYWQQLYGCAEVLLLTEVAAQQPLNCCLIVEDNRQAELIREQLLFFNPQQQVLHLPDWEILPYDRLSPAEEIISQRLHVLSQLEQLDHAILLLPLATLIQKLAPPDFIHQYRLQLGLNDQLKPSLFRQNLQKVGYQAVSQVMQHGEFAIRGAIIDIFPMGSSHPYRIDLFDDEIESIRYFDIDSQRSGKKVEQIDLLPTKEFPLNDDSIAYFRQQWRQQFSGNPSICPLYDAISNGQLSAGIEYYLPLFFEQTADIFNYLSHDTVMIYHASLTEKLSVRQQQINNRYQQLAHDITRPILAPPQLFLAENEVFAKLNQCRQIVIDNRDKTYRYGIDFHTTVPPSLPIQAKLSEPLAKLKDFLSQSKKTVLFCAESLGRREALSQLLQDAAIDTLIIDSWQQFTKQLSNASQPHYYLIHAPLLAGLEGDDVDCHIITESQLLGERVAQRQAKKTSINAETMIRSLAELKLGDPVVHINHGVGRYLGLETITLDQHIDEYLTLEYADNNKLYVPISSLQLISRYSGADNEQAPLHRLGNDQWQRHKEKAFKKIHDVAAQLLETYAKRAMRQSEAFALAAKDYHRFSNDFPFEETPDQAKAIEQVVADLCSNKPMDRLVCGDVGFGKTEVAMRAAFITAFNHRQVAILAPTTLLAQQHYQNFQDRFADWPIQLEQLSRFRSAKEQQKILQQLKNGNIDIIIGTHRLLQKDVTFKKLGLIIIDEEHRFGVRHKEKLRSLRHEVDILTLTATPIPRTLNLSLSAIRDLSLIATPPAKRLGIKTFVREYDKSIIIEAIGRELMRGGQVYYLHNNVQTIEQTAHDLQQLMPQARIAIGHGQMRESALEKVMTDFYHQRSNILVCTTIIESGIDVPTANTIIIDRADKLGLAQLHQLRGRVGRSDHQAYAYLLTPTHQSISSDAKKRLNAISSLEDLGAGFTLATHDLEIRGSGELLGDEQSGHIQTLGFSLYMELLEQTIADLKSGKIPQLQHALDEAIDIHFPINAIIPKDYLSDPHLRLNFYKRIANSEDEKSLAAIKIEMIDRFGLLPAEVENLLALTTLKKRALAIGIDKLSADQKTARITFSTHAKVDPQKIIQLVQAKKIMLNGETKISFPLSEKETLIGNFHQLLDCLEN